MKEFGGIFLDGRLWRFAEVFGENEGKERGVLVVSLW
jgi:hypothetical protein